MGSFLRCIKYRTKKIPSALLFTAILSAVSWNHLRRCMYLPHLSGGGKLGRGGTLGKIIRGHGNLEVSVLDVLKVAHADDPAGAGSLDDSVPGLGGTSALQVDGLSLAVGALEDLDTGLEGLLADVAGPGDELDGIDVRGDLEGADGADVVVGGGTALGEHLDRGSVEGLGGNGSDLLGASGGGDGHADLDGEGVLSSGGDAEHGVGVLLELNGAADGTLLAVHAVDVAGVGGTDGADEDLNLGLEGTAVGAEHVLSTKSTRGHLDCLSHWYW